MEGEVGAEDPGGGVEGEDGAEDEEPSHRGNGVTQRPAGTGVTGRGPVSLDGSKGALVWKV